MTEELDYTDLVRRLRSEGTEYAVRRSDLFAAADAIEFLLGEIDAHAELCPLMTDHRD